MVKEQGIKFFIKGIIVSTLMFFPFVLDPTLTPRFLSLALFVGLACYMIYRSASAFIVENDLITLSYAGYTLMCCLSVFWSNTSSEAIFESAKQVVNFIVFLLTYYSLKKNYDYFISTLLKFSILLFAFISLLILYQFITLQDTGKDAIYALKGLQGHKNLLSSFLFLDLFFLCLAFRKLDRGWRKAAMIAIVICIALLIVLKTKAVWLALLITLLFGGMLYLFSSKIKTSKPGINLAVLLIAALLIFNIFFLCFLQPMIQKGIHYTQAAGVTNVPASIQLEEERLVLWDKTYHVIKKNPLLGVGMGNWQIHFPDATLTGLWRGEDLNYTFQRPHNDFLWILSETGLLGFNLFLLFLFTLLFLLIRTLRILSANMLPVSEVILCTSFLVGYYTISFFDFPRERIEHGIWIHLILGIAYFVIKQNTSLKTLLRLQVAKPQLALLTMVAAFLVFVGLLRFNGEFFMRRLLIYKNSNRLSETISAGNSASSFVYSIDATSIPVTWYTGNAKASLGRYEEAQKDFLKAYKLNPYNRNILNDLGSSFVFTNNVLVAKSYYEEAARISPRFDEPKLNLAAMYINAHDFKTASFWLTSLMHDSERRTNYEKIVELSK